MGNTRCIICGLEKKGLKVRDDSVINAIRWFKRNITKNEKGYELVVCRDCYKKYRAARASFNKKRFAYTGIGVIATFFWILIGGIKAYSIFAGLLLIAFMYLLSLLSYIPALELDNKTELGKNEANSKRKKPKEH